MRSRIEDCALIGDTQTAALVARDGQSIGYVYRALTRAPALRRFWVRRSTAAGDWLRGWEG
jgi:hypothetical protein